MRGIRVQAQGEQTALNLMDAFSVDVVGIKDLVSFGPVVSVVRRQATDWDTRSKIVRFIDNVHEAIQHLVIIQPFSSIIFDNQLEKLEAEWVEIKQIIF